MANLTITTCRPVQVIEQFTAPAAADAAAGLMLSPDTNGKLAASAGTAGLFAGINITAVKANQAATVLVQGIADVGDALNALAYGALVYAAAAGVLADTGTVVVGDVVPGWASSTPDKLLHLTGAQ